ncbi:ChrR family anti-sigma-E factor [Mitsuaria sp. GD03876]|uniref:ChrR family anti-sigma-E factor n=1 Tax=Mitsuaria sp. GD03876 TaxID=2975399 RepID=UPI002448E386|nr:ChrR family anti-sigma-E factor [Mitsuaria sp. GD03876]MDH0863823.1 ChrR family anti-sigma-E factor [Mitsuaria sp. GD03876]
MPSPDIRHHPADELLLSLAAEALPTALRLVVETHLELCPACRERVAMLRAVGGTVLEEEPAAPMRDDALDRAFARIDALEREDAALARERADGGSPPSRPVPVPAPPPLPAGAVWPRALAHCAATRWRRIGPGMRWSRVTVPGAPEANLFLLRIEAGKYLPPHTHRGIELTQVIHGRFHDGRALFGPGDFDLADGEVHHQPVVQEGSECICIAAVEGRLRFDGLIARWFGALVGM